MRNAGMTDEQLDALCGVSAADDADFELYEENEEAARVFIACQTQWRLAVGATACVRIGLDYQSVSTVMDIYCVTDRRQCFDGVRVIEAEFLVLDSEKRG